MDVAIAGVATLLAFLIVGLMAYFAVRREPEGPRCPRCLNRVKPADLVCRSCRQPLP